MGLISAQRLRDLLHRPAPTVAAPVEAAYNKEDGNPAESTLDLRIAGIFVILVAGLLGCLPPLFLKVWYLLATI
jgi:hypothetical protein